MDLLFSRYASPLELMRFYINSGQFGEFVNEILELEEKRRQEKTQKEEDDKLWLAYIFSASDISYNDWKHDLKQQSQQNPALHPMTIEQSNSVKDKARNILKKFNPS